MKSIPLQYAIYWLSKDGFLQCETWPFTLQFVAFWKSVGLWRNLGLVLQHYWKRSFEERMWRSKLVLDVYKDFGQTVHSTSCAMSDVRVRTVTRIAYVAQNRFALPCHISYNCRSQARTGLTSFILLYHLIIIQYDNNGRKQG